MSSFLFYLCGDHNKASSRVRGYWIIEALLSLGNRCSTEYHHSKAALVSFLIRIPFHDVIVFQKTYSRWHCLLLRWASLLNKTTLLDLDDAPSRTNSPVTLRNVEYMMRRVSIVTVGSRFLQDYASQFSKDVRLIPSSIRLSNYHPIDKKDKDTATICLGWIGNGAHYKQDLIEVLKAPLTRIAKETPFRFKVIGACSEEALYQAFSGISGLQMDFVDTIEWSDPDAVSLALSDVNIGLYPLLLNDFNQYKCGFKALEYMAMGIPVISSDIAENREIIEQGVTGLFAKCEEEWVDSIRYLLTQKAKREEIGANGRCKVEAQYSIALSAKSILAAIQEREN